MSVEQMETSLVYEIGALAGEAIAKRNGAEKNIKGLLVTEELRHKFMSEMHLPGFREKLIEGILSKGGWSAVEPKETTGAIKGVQIKSEVLLLALKEIIEAVAPTINNVESFKDHLVNEITGYWKNPRSKGLSDGELILKSASWEEMSSSAPKGFQIWAGKGEVWNGVHEALEKGSSNLRALFKALRDRDTPEDKKTESLKLILSEAYKNEGESFEIIAKALGEMEMIEGTEILSKVLMESTMPADFTGSLIFQSLSSVRDKLKDGANEYDYFRYMLTNDKEKRKSVLSELFSKKEDREILSKLEIINSADKRILTSYRDASGRSLLHIAADNLNLREVALLIKSGIDVNEQDAYGNTPLHIVANCLDKTSKDKQAVNENIRLIGLLLIEAGASTTEIKNEEGFSPKMVARVAGGQNVEEMIDQWEKEESNRLLKGFGGDPSNKLGEKRRAGEFFSHGGPKAY